MMSSMKRCMRDQLVVNEEDRISQLPEALLVHILSLLTTKEAIATSVLSKQWQFLWKMLPKLTFESGDHGFEFGKDVCKALLAHKAPVLESLHLEIELEKCAAVDISILLGIAFGRNVRELSLDAYDEVKKKRSFVFPTCFLTSDTIETLALRFLVLKDVPSQIRLKSLKTLHLDYMKYKNDASVHNLFSGCPALETLFFRRYPYGGKTDIFTIAVPSLLNLTITDESAGDEHEGYVIIAPRLKFLHFEWSGPDSCGIVNSPELVTATLICEKINLGSITSVEALSLLLWSPLELTCPTGSIFYRLEYLELYTSKPAWWNLLTLMLDTSPKLEVLRLRVDHNGHAVSNHVGSSTEKWNQPKNVPECLLLHLESFEWEGYKGTREEEEVAKYILTNAGRLKEATFFGVNPSLRKRLEKLYESKSVVMASKSCKVVFDFDEEI